MKAKTLIENEEAEAAKSFLQDLVKRLKETYGVNASLRTKGPSTPIEYSPGSPFGYTSGFFEALVKVNGKQMFVLEIGNLTWHWNRKLKPYPYDGLTDRAKQEIEWLRGSKAELFDYTSGLPEDCHGSWQRPRQPLPNPEEVDNRGRSNQYFFKNVGDALLAAEQICETFCAKLGRTSPAASTPSQFVVLYDAGMSGSAFGGDDPLDSATVKGHYYDKPRGVLVDQEIKDIPADLEPTASVTLYNTDGEVAKYGEWKVTPKILKQLALAHQASASPPVPDDAWVMQAQALLAHLDEVARLLNSGGGEVGGDEEEL